MTKAAIDPRGFLFIGGFGSLNQDERSFKEETAFWIGTSISDAARQCQGEEKQKRLSKTEYPINLQNKGTDGG